ncbi:P-loop containing nucleoside triphosphate hydrolase protein [Camillea tinctor]|nr:P-loop containing nucleoside triphosphate hydrolase protein [Camillea tinctor]
MALQQNLEPEKEWQAIKSKGVTNEPLDKLMNMVGLTEVKDAFLRMRDKIELSKQRYGLGKERFSTVFLGNPGTGKTTVARIYFEFLKSLGIFDNVSRQWSYAETTGSSIASKGVAALEQMIKGITSMGVGVIFIDETYQLVNGHSGSGASVLDFLLGEMENLRDRIVFVFAGYKTDMEKFYAHNTGIRGRIGYTFKFEDYNETQILTLLRAQITRRFSAQMRIEPCPSQPNEPEHYVKIAARRISSGRDQEGFANARAVENAASLIDGRLCQRLKREQRYHETYGGNAPNYFLMTGEDLLGPASTNGIYNSKAWKELDAMIGLKSVKESVRGMVVDFQLNREREMRNEPRLKESLNQVFLGNPGTGKTTVAKLYGQILVELGMLSNGEVVVKTPADFIGQHIGGSETNTKAILEATRGKVLVIDEAYQLNSKSGAKGTHGITDPFKTAVLDTIVAKVDSKAGDDRCVLLLGYKDKMEEMFQDGNPGLKRRFPIDNAFVFEDYTPDEMRQIWRQKLQARVLNVSPGVEDKVMEILERQRHKLNFGNAGEVEIMLDTAQKRYRQRIQADPSMFGLNVNLELSDIDPDFERLGKATHDVEELFKGVIGCDEVKKVISSWPRRANIAKKHGLDICGRIPLTMCFTGPPGTGKTTTAKNIGTIMYNIGLLASNEVNEISANELVGEYIGHTGPKVQRQFEASLGKVLFIDEAYRLCNSSFGKEAMDEIVTCLTNEKFKGHLVVIFAGYDEEIKKLVNLNPGMASRIQETIRFPPLSAADAVKLLDMHVNKPPFQAECLKNGGAPAVLKKLDTLVRLSGWANGRSIDTLSKRITNATMDTETTGPVLHVSRHIVVDQLSLLQSELESLAGVRQNTNTGDTAAPEADLDANVSAPPPASPKKLPTVMDLTMPLASPTSKPINFCPAPGGSKRTYDKYEEDLTEEDQGGSWMDMVGSLPGAGVAKGLQGWFTGAPPPPPGEAMAKMAQIRKQLEEEARQRKKEREDQRRKREEERRRKKAEKEAERKRKEEEIKKREEAKKKKEEEIKKKEEERKKKEEEIKKAAREEEARKQALMKQMGRCPANFDWINQGNGMYRCAGGSHTISESELTGRK